MGEKEFNPHMANFLDSIGVFIGSGNSLGDASAEEVNIYKSGKSLVENYPEPLIRDNLSGGSGLFVLAFFIAIVAGNKYLGIKLQDVAYVAFMFITLYTCYVFLYGIYAQYLAGFCF